MLIQDLQWIIDSSHKDTALPSTDDIQAWLFLASERHHWNHIIRAAKFNKLHRLQDNRSLTIWHAQLRDIYDEVNLQLPPFLPVRAKEENFICYECGASFPTKRGWHNHRALKHNITPQNRFYIHGNVCLACNTDFHTISRLDVHLRRRPQCLAVLMDNIDPLTDDIIDDIYDQEDKQNRDIEAIGFHSQKVFIPPTKLQGPTWQCTVTKKQAQCRLIQPTSTADSEAPPNAMPLTPCYEVRHSLVPGPSLKVYFVLHFFSGQRRSEDFQ